MWRGEGKVATKKVESRRVFFRAEKEMTMDVGVWLRSLGLGQYEVGINVTGLVAKYVKIIPASPFGGFALSKSATLHETIKTAIDLRD
jgi:hypothetical protein